MRRVAPGLVPELPNDIFPYPQTKAGKKVARSQIQIKPFNLTDVLDPAKMKVVVRGAMAHTSKISSSSQLPIINVTNGTFDVPSSQLEIVKRSGNNTVGVFDFQAGAEFPRPIELGERFKTWVPVARDKTMVVVVARTEVGGMPSGFVEMI